MDNTYTILLELVGQLVDNERRIQAERTDRGENYNVFNVLGLWSEEVRLHSAFLANLLNPLANHGLKDAFLKAFINITESQYLNLAPERCEVSVERSIGHVNEDQTQGGRIDIIIEDKVARKAIIIENKIYAGDQPNQLLRYCNYAKSQYPGGFQILYLTLYGSDVESKLPECEQKLSNAKPISYSDNIKEWLEQCIELAARQPLVRETVAQYQTLVKQITNQTMETSTSQKLAEILAKPENTEKAVAIFDYQVINLWREKALAALCHKLQSWAEQSANMKFGCFGTPGNKESGYYFHKEEWKTMAIFVYTETRDYREYYYGISNFANSIKEGQPRIELDSLASATTDAWPYGWQRLDSEYKNWTNEIFADMLQPESKLANAITTKIDEIRRELEQKKIELY